jgi:tRNA pseudouridine38-40 synthase
MYEICVSKTTITPNIHFGMKNGEEIVLLFRANAFLYHQVRRMVGILVQVGLGNMSAADVESIIQKKHCSACGGVYVAPAEGLYLSSVLDTL